MEHRGGLLADPRFWVSLAFVVFMVIFGKRLVTALNGVLDKRAVEVRDELDSAARLKREAEQMLAEAKLQREAALKEAVALLDHARGEAARMAKAARAEQEASSRRREKMAIDRISAAEKAAVTDVRLAAADVASRAVEQVLLSGFGAEADAPLIDRAIAGLPSALAGRQAA